MDCRLGNGTRGRIILVMEWNWREPHSLLILRLNCFDNNWRYWTSVLFLIDSCFSDRTSVRNSYLYLSYWTSNLSSETFLLETSFVSLGTLITFSNLLYSITLYYYLERLYTLAKKAVKTSFLNPLDSSTCAICSLNLATIDSSYSL